MKRQHDIEARRFVRAHLAEPLVALLRAHQPDPRGLRFSAWPPRQHHLRRRHGDPWAHQPRLCPRYRCTDPARLDRAASRRPSGVVPLLLLRPALHRRLRAPEAVGLSMLLARQLPEPERSALRSPDPASREAASASRGHGLQGSHRLRPLRRQPARQAEAHALAHLSPPCRQLEEIEREAARLFHVQPARVLGRFAELGASVP
jgi:hypothetical protein